jgi:NADP-dependent 3-hydroxy acid dehydrogenase YdfG
MAASRGLVVITGASSGIGAECARRFSAAGHPLLLLARRVERMEALALPECLCEAVDVTKFDEFQAAVKKGEARFGPVACIINNAGIMLLGHAHDQSVDEWRQMLDVNVMGVLHGVKCVIDGMVARQSGCIINVSSVAGRKTFGDHAVYCATKFGVHALTENFRSEYAQHNVKFCIVAPGVVETELLGHTTNDVVVEGYKQWKATIEALQPIDVANACYFVFDQPARCCIREIVLAPTKQGP